jgi:DedD protein
MASKEKKNSGDFILESRHLVGLFLLLVVIFGVVFTLGYLLGRSQYDSQLRAAVGPPPGSEELTSRPAAKIKNQPAHENTPPAQKNSDWDFFHSAEPQSDQEHLQPPPKAAASAQPAAAPKPAAVSPNSAKAANPSPGAGAEGPLIPKGAIMLQVAAVFHQDDALALAQALQQKKFPAFVITPAADKYYRVQVGPYNDNQTASKARADLEANGFKSIVKR